MYEIGIKLMTVLLKVAKKRRNLMKKLINIMLYIFLIFHLTGCIKVNSGIKTHHVDSQIYQQDDIDLAIETIKKEFKNEWKGCTLTEIYYAGDQMSQDHQDWADRYQKDEVIVLLSSFDVDLSGGDGSLSPNSTYSDYMLILVRTKGENWKHVDHGYG